MKDDKHTVSYTSIDYHSMCQRSKERIKKMQAEGIPTSMTQRTSQRTQAKGMVTLSCSCHSSQLFPVQASCCDPSVISLASSISLSLIHI